MQDSNFNKSIMCVGEFIYVQKSSKYCSTSVDVLY
jgi:hypothetical protein